SGTFTLTFTGPDGSGATVSATTAALDAVAGGGILAGNIQTALKNLPNIGGIGGSVVVTVAGRVATITFEGALDHKNLAPMTAFPSGVTVATVTEGGLDPAHPHASSAVAVAPGASYPLLILTVNIATNAPSSITNTVTVSGGGETNTDNDTAADTATLQTVTTPPPVITHPASVIVSASSPAGAQVFFTVTATDVVDGSDPVIANPPSGSTFPFGTTTVNLSCTDSAGLSTNSSFTITVVQVVQQFDFNGGSAVTQVPVASPEMPDGYIGVRGNDTYVAGARGYGWLSAVGEFDRGSLGATPQADLRRDGH